MHDCPAKNLNNKHRENIALDIISNNKTITQAANDNNTSRKFIKKQKDKALKSIKKNFNKQESNVLFYLPISQNWIHQFILALVLFCKASYRNIIGILEYLFNYKTSLGTIFNIANKASTKAEEINNEQDLSKIKDAAIDELFLNNSPILTGVDLDSTYCFLLKDEEDRQSATWAKNLNSLKQQGLNPKKFIADLGSGLRSGLNISYNKTPCHADIFHILFDLKKLSLYFRNREKSRKTLLEKLSSKLNRAKVSKKINDLNKQIITAEEEFIKFNRLASNLSTLVDWMAHDVLSVAGSDPESRNILYDFIVDELKSLEGIHSHKIKSSRVTLENNKKIILAFTLDMDLEFTKLAEDYNISKDKIWSLCELHRCERFSEKYYSRSQDIKNDLGAKNYILLLGIVGNIIRSTNRTSSLVENINSRIRPFCNLRKQMGNNFSELLKFFLNHNPLVCSRKKSRKNKTPAEILNKKQHPHWLEMLGFEKVLPVNI